MKCALLASGGKDCWLAAWYAACSGLDLARVLTFFPKKADSFMFHGINSELVKTQAEAAGIRHTGIATSGESGREQAELTGAFGRLGRQGISGVVSGAFESEYQRERIERACDETGLVHFAPLWHKGQEQLLGEMLSSGLDAVIVAVAADGMGPEWLGRRISEARDALLELSRKRKISPVGEGGEFETFAVQSPLFSRELKIGTSTTHWSGCSGSLRVTSLC